MKQSKETIVHVITNFAGVGGAEMMLARLIQQTEHHCEHVIIALMETSEVYQSTLERCKAYYALGWNGLNSLQVITQLRKLLPQFSPKSVQCWMYHANILTSLSVMGLKHPPKIFWGIHHSLSSPKEESISTKVALAMSKFLAGKPAGIIYCAHSSLSQHRQFGFHNQNSTVIPNGVFLDEFQLNTKLHQPLVVGFAGRYHTAKGYPYLFETMAKLKDQQIIFKIAGSGASLDNVKVKSLFEQYQLDINKVQLLDQISDMSTFYQSIDVFLMTSITEGFPNVLVEAMASGVPCISTDVGDAKYIVGNNEYIVEARDSNALRNAILKYYNLSVSEKIKLKEKSREKVEKKFSIDGVAMEYMKFWEN
jgi:glycosyltransferase involved in cell wall biosynthesis